MPAGTYLSLHSMTPYILRHDPTCAAFGSRPRLGSPYLTASARAPKRQLGGWDLISAEQQLWWDKVSHGSHIYGIRCPFPVGESYRTNSNHPANICKPSFMGFHILLHGGARCLRGKFFAVPRTALQNDSKHSRTLSCTKCGLSGMFKV